MSGWKVSQPIKWTINSNTKLSNIGQLWLKPYSEIRLHGPDRFMDKQSAKVSPTLQSGLKKLYQYLKTTVSPARGGTATGSITNKHMANGAYIWRVFRQQAYLLWKNEEEELNNNTVTPELRELLDDVSKNRELCSKFWDTPGNEGGEAGRREKPSRALTALKNGATIKGLNNPDAMPPSRKSSEKKFGIDQLHQLPEAVPGDGKKGLWLDPAIIPNPHPPGYKFPNPRRFKPVPMSELKDLIMEFLEASPSQELENPLNRYMITDDEPNNRKRGRESSSEPEDDIDEVELEQQTPSRKRVRLSPNVEQRENPVEDQNDQVREVESPAVAVPEPVWDPDLVEALIAECKDPWTTGQVLLWVASIGRTPPDKLRRALIDGMWDTPDVIEENEKLGTPFNNAIARALRSLDEAVIHL